MACTHFLLNFRNKIIIIELILFIFFNQILLNPEFGKDPINFINSEGHFIARWLQCDSFRIPNK